MGFQPNVGMIGKNAKRAIALYIVIRQQSKRMAWSSCLLLQMETSVHVHTKQSAAHILLDAWVNHIGAKGMTVDE